MYHCTRCGRTPDETPFRLRKSGKPQSLCTECDRAYKHEHYLADIPGYVAKAKAASGRRWNRYQALKESPCIDCGVQYPPWVMQFDHLPGSDKIDDVATLVRKGYGWSRIMTEVEKCDLVCANCHAERTHMRL